MQRLLLLAEQQRASVSSSLLLIVLTQPGVATVDADAFGGAMRRGALAGLAALGMLLEPIRV